MNQFMLSLLSKFKYLSDMKIYQYRLRDFYNIKHKCSSLIKKNMCNLAGYTHQIVYIFISLLSIKQNSISYYLLYMIEELPTFFLSSVHFNKKLRCDNLFGFAFFCTRILYHIYFIIH